MQQRAAYSPYAPSCGYAKLALYHPPYAPFFYMDNVPHRYRKFTVCVSHFLAFCPLPFMFYRI